jgi:two-component sensor histidine kinase/putative methionine-R-sulfoxide reductase with GAF domain
MSLEIEQGEALGRALERLRKLDLGGEEIKGALRAALADGGIAKLLSWAREHGEERALAGTDMQAVIEEAMAAGDALSSLLASELEGERLAPALVSACVDGYLAAQGRHATSKREAQDELLRRRVDELTALHRIISAANSSLKLNDTLSEMVQAVVAVTGADVCSIFLYEPEWDQLVLTATSGLSQDAVGKVRLQVGEGLTGWAALVGKPVAVRDARHDPRFKYVAVLGEDPAVSMLAVPVVLFTKEKLVGVITLQNFEERDYTDSEIRFLETVAGEIAIAIENARLYEQTDARLQQKVAELSTLQGVSAHIAATLNLPEVLTLIAYQAAHLVHADAAAIYELHSGAGMLELVAQYDLRDITHSIHQGKAVQRVLLNVEASDIAGAIRRGIPIPLSPSADAHLDIPFAPEGYRSMFCVPLVAPRAIMGGICLYNLDDKVFTDEQVRLLDAFGHEAAIALENSRLYDAALRGLRTKSALLQEMNHRVRNNLQTVAGLLSMQLRRMPAESEAATVVRESIARVQSIAAVHDLMVRGDVEMVGIHELARKVADAAVSTLTDPGFDLKLAIDVPENEQMRVGSQHATLLALLFNELISNTILHGFTGRTKGKISIRARIDRDTNGREGEAAHRVAPTVRIEVADDGVGLPEGFDPQQDANLGLNIVQTLVVSDLRGSFKLEPGEGGVGTVASINFMPARPGVRD